MAGPQDEDETHSGHSEAALAESNDQSSKPPFSLPHEIAFVAIICAAQLLTQAGLYQSFTPLHIIGDTFGAKNPSELAWYPASYSLTVGTFIIVAGRLGDMFGPKRMFLIGFIWFAIWSFVVGLSVYSKQQIFFNVCRALQGIGPAILLPNALAILGRTYPQGRRKSVVFSLFGATAPSGGLMGSLFSGLFAQLLWWPWAFWALAIVCGACAALAWWVIPACPPLGEGGGRFDYAGAVTGVAGLVLFNVAWNQAPIVGWRTPYVCILLVLGLLCFTAFCFIEQRAARPLVPLKALSGHAGFVLVCVALGWASFGIWIYYLWQMWEVLRKLTPLHATAQMVPDALSGFCAALTTGFLLGRVRPAYLMVFAMVAFCVGNTLLATMPVDQIYWKQTFLSIVISPWGMDTSFTTATVILSDHAGPEHQGIGASLVNTIVNYSISIGLGIAGTVEVYVNNGGTNPADILKGYRGAWYSGIGLSGLGILFALYFAFEDRKRKS